MADKTNPPVWFWIVAGIAFIWNALGVNAYVETVTMTEEGFAAMSAAERGLYENVPSWATAAFALAVWGGTIGSLGLLLRRAFTYYILILSLLGIIVQLIYNVFMSQSMDVYGPGPALVMPMMVLIIGVLLVWLARFAKSKQWIV